jgi:hypothetical protein
LITRIDNMTSKLKQYKEETKLTMRQPPKKQRVHLFDREGKHITTTPVLNDRITQEVADTFGATSFPLDFKEAVIEELDIVSPIDGGCWFCNTVTEEMTFDTEFDTNVHIDCIEDAIREGNPEAEIMSYLLETNY